MRAVAAGLAVGLPLGWRWGCAAVDGLAVGLGSPAAEPVPSRAMDDRTAPPTTDVLRLDQPTVDALVAHARSDHPYEVCGLLGLRRDGSIEHFPITNAERSMTFYTMEPRELLRAMRRIEDEGMELVIYHSHTHTEAYPSETDIRLAAYPEATYLIISLEDPDRPVLRAFRIVDGEVTERPIEVT